MASRYRRASSAKRGSVYERVTARIVDQLQRGVQPWFQPWSNGGPPCSLLPVRVRGTSRADRTNRSERRLTTSAERPPVARRGTLADIVSE